MISGNREARGSVPIRMEAEFGVLGEATSGLAPKAAAKKPNAIR
jgi:hypothetical protein